MFQIFLDTLLLVTIINSIKTYKCKPDVIQTLSFSRPFPIAPCVLDFSHLLLKWKNPLTTEMLRNDTHLETVNECRIHMNSNFFFFFQLNRNDLLGGQTPFKGMHNNPHKVCFLYNLRLWLMNCKISLTPFIIIKSPSRNILQEIPVQRNSIFKILQTKLYQFHLGQAYHFCVEVTWEKKKIKGK